MYELRRHCTHTITSGEEREQLKQFETASLCIIVMHTTIEREHTDHTLFMQLVLVVEQSNTLRDAECMWT